MRNANERYESAAQMGHVAYNTMYDSPLGLVHRKVVAVLMEEAYPSEEGMCAVYAIMPNQLRAVAKGPATTPRKPKNRPKKGTKPWTKIPYRFEDVEVGDIVTYHCVGLKYSHKITQKEDGFWIAEDSAKGYREWSPTQDQQAHILKPYKESVKPQEEEVYQIGDRFEIMVDGITYFKVMLCRIEDFEAKLIVYEGEEIGNRWSDSKIEIRLDSAVNAKDLHNIIDHSSYTYKKI